MNCNSRSHKLHDLWFVQIGKNCSWEQSTTLAQVQATRYNAHLSEYTWDPIQFNFFSPNKLLYWQTYQIRFKMRTECIP